MIQWPEITLRTRPRREYVVTRNGQQIVVPYSVTQIVKGADGPESLIQWNINNTLSYLEAKPEHIDLGHHLLTPGDIEGARYYHKRVLTEYGTFGTMVHTLIESEITGQEHGYPVVGARALACVEAWRAWWETMGVAEIVAVEQQVFCADPVPYAGTFDLMFRDSEGRYHLADWKTSKSLRAKYWVQLGAYARAMKIEHGIQIHRAHLVRVCGDTTSYQHHEIEHLDRLGELFAVELTNLNNYRNLEKHIKENMRK